jgi:putative ABC transport system permease protein
LQKGSRINYRQFIKFKSNINGEALPKKIESRLDLEGFWFDTIETEKEDTGRSFQDLTEYLQLVAFIALLLGCIGVVSAIHVYVREKIGTIAILRCLGAKSWDAFFIFLLQVAAIGLVCSVVGAALGSLVQLVLPYLLQDLIPFTITSTISWPSIFQGIALGVVIAVLFALLPLVNVRKISPLNTLRLSFQHEKQSADPLKWVVRLLVIVFLYLLMLIQLESWMKALIFMAGILAAFLLLALVAALLMWMGRNFFPSKWKYTWRQGILNLYRPNNQTLILIVAIGFGTAFITTLFFVQSILINRVALTASGNQPNIVLFDIQSPQRAEVMQIAQVHGLPANPMVPIVNMRLDEVNGRKAMDVQEDTMRDMSMRLYTREYRVTFRDSTTASEKIVEGRWRGSPDPATGTIYISLEKGFASRFELKVGDTLVFNVQGALIPTVIGSLREVDWNRIQANFLVVFPKGVLEEAPQFHVYMAHAPSDTASVRFQQAVVQRFPNVSIIDLALVLSVLRDIMDKISFVIRFIAGFSILTGLVVLVISVLISKYQRMQENVLLRTLGASGSQVLTITALEYFFLGVMAALAGIILAFGASWALARFNFDTVFNPPLLPVVIIFVFICCVTVVIGVLNSRTILNRPPLEVLRQEV